MSERKRKLEPAKPNVVDDYAELCDTLKDKYKMTDGDWKILLESGMALYKHSPDRPHLPEARASETDGERLQRFRRLREDMRRHADAYLESMSRMVDTTQARRQYRPQDRS